MSFDPRLNKPTWGDELLTDYRYINLEENFTDYYPEMAKGRISVSNGEEALAVIEKITRYESHPPREMNDYYQNLLSCSYFQDHKADYCIYHFKSVPDNS